MTLVERLLMEANASEELHPGDSDIETMREAAAALTDLLSAAKRLSALADDIWVKMSDTEFRASREVYAALDAAIAKATAS